MTQKNVAMHLRAALDEVVANEKERLHKLHNQMDADANGRIEMMRPIIEVLSSIKDEIGIIEGLDISPAAQGHMVSVKLQSRVSRHSFSASTNMGNSAFEVEERCSYTFTSDSDEKSHRFSKAEDVLALLINAVGKHVASHQVAGERGTSESM